MQFNGHSTNQDIISDITFLLGGIGTADYSLNDRTRNVNLHYSDIWAMIFEAYNGWKFMDDNVSDASTGIPSADQTVTSGTGLYGLPTGSLIVDNVAIKLTASGPFQNLIPFSYEKFVQVGGDGYFSSNATPFAYLLQGDILRLLPTPNFTLASALRVYFQQEMSLFSASDTTKVPGFASPFHRMLSIGAALDFAIARNMVDRIKILSSAPYQMSTYEDRLRSFYSKRFAARFPARMVPGGDLVKENT